MYPNIVLQADLVDLGILTTLQTHEVHELLAKHLCDVVTLQCGWSSTFSDPSDDIEHEQTHLNMEKLQTSYLQYYIDLMNLDWSSAKLQLDMKVTFTRRVVDQEKYGIAAALGRSTNSLSIDGDLPLFVQHIPMTNLTRLCYRLPISTSASAALTAVQQIQAALVSLQSLCCLHIEAWGGSYGHAIQPAAVVQVVPLLPNLSSLIVDTNANPYCLESSLLTSITHLWLGRNVTFDSPPENLQRLHLAYLSESCRPMMLQLEKRERHLSCITVGSFVAGDQFEASGLLQLPVNLAGLHLLKRLDTGFAEVPGDRLCYKQGLSRLSQLQSLMFNEPLSEYMVELLKGFHFARLHRLGFWLAEKSLDAIVDHDTLVEVRKVSVSLPVQFADLSTVFPLVEVIDILGVQMQPGNLYATGSHCVLCLDSWWMGQEFPHLKRVWNRCCNCSLQLRNLPSDCRVIAL